MAEAEFTKKYSLKFENLKYKILGKTNYTVSICGFGSYRIDQGINRHKSALELALKNGINLIDTSANYTDGGSESLVGTVLNNLFSSGEMHRDELILVTKGGYIQGENLKFAQQKEAEGRPYNDVVKCSPELWHCIHPKFLQDQITLSLKKLSIKKIDIYLLHNPEYFFTCSNIKDAVAREKEFYSRIKMAFIHLEKEVEKGRISFYGISSNTFGEEPTKINFVSLEKTLKIAEEISKQNHFAVIQFPLNLNEKRAAVNKNQNNNTETVLEYAYKNNIGVLINRPLNAIENNKIIRLADFNIKENRNIDEINNLISDLADQEENLKKNFVDKIDFAPSEKRSMYDCLSLAAIISGNYNRFETPHQFQEMKGYYLIPRANYAISELVNKKRDDEDLIKVVRKYAVTTNILLDSVESSLAVKQNKLNQKVHADLNKYLSKEQQKLTLSQKSILMINSLNEVSSTLVGMRRPDYVEDVLGSIRSDYVNNVKNYWLKD